MRKKLDAKIKWIWAIVILLLLLIGSPLITLLNRTEPKVFGLPFLYASVFLIWVTLCILLFLGSLLAWGDTKPRKRRRKRDR